MFCCLIVRVSYKPDVKRTLGMSHNCVKSRLDRSVERAPNRILRGRVFGRLVVSRDPVTGVECSAGSPITSANGGRHAWCERGQWGLIGDPQGTGGEPLRAVSLSPSGAERAVDYATQQSCDLQTNHRSAASCGCLSPAKEPSSWLLTTPISVCT